MILQPTDVIHLRKVNFFSYLIQCNVNVLTYYRSHGYEYSKFF